MLHSTFPEWSPFIVITQQDQWCPSLSTLKGWKLFIHAAIFGISFVSVKRIRGMHKMMRFRLSLYRDLMGFTEQAEQNRTGHPRYYPQYPAVTRVLTSTNTPKVAFIHLKQRLTVQWAYTFLVCVCDPCGNWTHDFGVASTSSYQIKNTVIHYSSKLSAWQSTKLKCVYFSFVKWYSQKWRDGRNEIHEHTRHKGQGSLPISGPQNCLPPRHRHLVFHTLITGQGNNGRSRELSRRLISFH